MTGPTGGWATVAGHDVAKEPDAVRLRIGVALQAAALDNQQTGTELLRQQGRYYGLRPREIDERMAELRELIDIGDALGQFRDRLWRVVLGRIVQQEVLLRVRGCVDLRPGADGGRIGLIVSAAIW